MTTDIVPLFLQILAEDIRQYGSLPDYTLRRISTHEAVESNQASLTRFFEEIHKLRNEMGDNYLTKIREKIRYSASEIIIAIENQGVRL